MPDELPSIEIDDSSTLIVTFARTIDAEELARFLDRLAQELLSRQGYAAVVDATQVRESSAQRRRLMAEFLKRHEREIAHRCRGVAYVLPSAFQRGILTALLWLTKHPVHWVIVGTREQALAWARTTAAGAKSA